MSSSPSPTLILNLEDEMREVKNQLSIDGHIDSAFRAILGCNEPDAIHVALVALAHAAVDATRAARSAPTPAAAPAQEPQQPAHGDDGTHHVPRACMAAVQPTEPGKPQWFPLIGTGLAVQRAHLDEQQAQRNHGQSLDRLAERGGLSPSEALAVINHQRWQHMSLKEALTELVALAKPVQHGQPQGGSNG